LIVEQLCRHFGNPKFLFMLRDPYATVEGIRRRLDPKRNMRVPEGDLLHAVARHVMACFRYQRSNVETYADRGVFFSYERMCETPEQVERQIMALVPELDDLQVRQRVAVKDYDEELRNMNDQQIARLTPDDLRRINEVFAEHQGLLDYFGYALRS
jgi:hypothetical protein